MFGGLNIFRHLSLEKSSSGLDGIMGQALLEIFTNLSFYFSIQNLDVENWFSSGACGIQFLIEFYENYSFAHLCFNMFFHIN